MAGLFSAPEAPAVPPPPIPPNPNTNQQTAESMRAAADAQASKRRNKASTLLTGQTGLDTGTAQTASRSLMGL